MHKLQAYYMEIFVDVVEVAEGGDDYAVFVAKNREKRYRQGYSQFLAELTTLEILNREALELTFTKLIGLIQQYGEASDKKALVEEYTDCLVRMSRVLKKKNTVFFQEARASLTVLCSKGLTECIERKDAYPSLSAKARFLLMDVRDNLSTN